MSHLTSKIIPTPYFPFLAIMSLLLLAFPVAAQNVTVEAQLDRKEIQLGGHALLDITISGDNGASVAMPQIDGLSIRAQGRSTQRQIANGHVTLSASLRYQITPNKEGVFKIPPIAINSDGNKITTKEQLTLKVTKGAPAGQANLNATEDLGELAFIDVVGLKDQAVVGELIPIEIRAFFKSGVQVSLESAPALEGSSFIIKINDDKPRQGRTTIDGTSYFVVIFKSSISPIKAGEFDLSFNMGATLHIEDRRPQPKRRSRRSPFGDDLFGSMFTPRIKKSVKLATTPHKVIVTAPPADSQPDGFSGTIGQFSIAARASASTVRAGDPITLVTRVTGKGNLDRVPMPHMANPSGWKTYPAKHEIKKSYTTASDGTKLFNQIIVPKNESVTEIPSLELVYFDPIAKEYKTARTAPIPIKVTPGTDITEHTPETNTASNPPTPTGPTTEVPNSHIGWLRSERIDQAPWFIGTIGGLIAVLMTWPILTVWQRRHNTPERKASAVKDKQIKSALLDMEQSIKNQNALTFFEAARHALQIQWSTQLNIAAEAVTGTDLPDDTARSVFNTADSIVFSGDAHSSLDLKYWQQQTLRALEHLNTTNK
jgi:hypothetical protein